MPLAQTIGILLLAIAIAWFGGHASPAARRSLSNRRVWAAMAVGGMFLSAASWLVTSERMGGTLLQRLHGWPKVYSFECISPECEDRGPSFSLLYFLGNSFVYLAGLIFLWTVVAILTAIFRDRSNAPSP